MFNITASILLLLLTALPLERLFADEMECSSQTRHLIEGESTDVLVLSKAKLCKTGVILKPNHKYSFSLKSISIDWKDGKVQFHPLSKELLSVDGWDYSWLPFWKRGIKYLGFLKRCKNANWFELIGATDSSFEQFRLGDGIINDKVYSHEEEISEELIIYVNDWDKKYHNNDGTMILQISNLGIDLTSYNPMAPCA